MTTVQEDYLNISVSFEYDNSVEKNNYIASDPQVGCNYNQQGNIIITTNTTSDLLLLSKGFLFIQGRLRKTDGTRFAPDAQGIYPDIALINNAFLYLFSNIKFSINDVEVENFTCSGYNNK
jgi:hypothetical protein